MDLRRLNSVSEPPKFQYESISTVCNQVRPHDLLITDRYRERLSPYSGASGRQKIPRHSLEKVIGVNELLSSSDSTEARI